MFYRTGSGLYLTSLLDIKTRRIFTSTIHLKLHPGAVLVHGYSIPACQRNQLQQIKNKILKRQIKLTNILTISKNE